ncbi:hypothetical protein BD410DRAFT_394386 [Rickenella mellea]|uniref:Non-specific serine/threonine protein kinase n=1 Tax=Rickenella mellea TaxID=50990 RepID=A0A4Y7PX02_9AGAM|nr:hypothetical protein BD410DRAFT_394386 [Rickenella mellea]
MERKYFTRFEVRFRFDLGQRLADRREPRTEPSSRSSEPNLTRPEPRVGSEVEPGSGRFDPNIGNITVNFKYLHQIDEKMLLFICETDNSERICIKFVRRYSQAVHEKCAEMGIAPRLRGLKDIGAGWKMVIMDALDEEYKLFDIDMSFVDIREQIRARLVELHQANLVHGDVRDANLMVRKDGKPGFMLIDFDWSGIIGEVRYPINVNKVDIWRPDDVSDGLLIKSNHDMDMLEHIFR